jgi:hypothetical protein
MEQSGFPSETGHEPGALEGLGQEGYMPEAEPDPLAGGPGQKKKHTGVVVLIVVAGLAIGSLFSMHTLTKVTAASGRDTETEKTIETFLNSIGGSSGTETDSGESTESLVQGHKEVVGVLRDDFTQHQIKQLARDPFDVMSGALVVGDLSGADGDYARAKRIDDIDRAAEGFELKSVIMGSRPLANMNGRIVRLNQVIPVDGGRSVGILKFRVVSISPESVTVVAEDPQLDLRVEKVIHLKR